MNRLLTAGNLAKWSHGRWVGDIPVKVGRICHDTRTLNRGDVYVALKGDNFDGHNFVKAAFEKGAVGAVIDENRDSRNGATEGFFSGPVLLVKDTGDALMEMAAGYRRSLSSLCVVGITGSTGKTTVKEMLAGMIERNSNVARTHGNWNNSVGLPLSLLAMEESTQTGVFEVGTNHPGELRPLCRVLSPDIAVITNIAPVHVEHFHSLEAIAEEKSELLKALPEGGIAIMSEPTRSFDAVKKAVCPKVITVGIEEGNGYRCISLNREDWSAVVEEVSSGERVEIKTPVPGEHNLMNVMLALACARHLKVDWEDIQEALRVYKAPPMRWQVHRFGTRIVINDAYNANPLSMRTAVDTFLDQNHRCKWLILGDMAELGEAESSEHIRMGEYLGLRQWAGVIVVGRLGELIAEGIRRTRGATQRVFVVHDNAAAADIAIDKVEEGSEMLIKGSRFMQMELIVERLNKMWS